MNSSATTSVHKDILETFSEKFPVFEKAYALYTSFEEMNGSSEDTLKKSAEITLLEILELIVIASRQNKESKRTTLRQALVKLDTLKVFADLAHKVQGVNDDTSLKISEQLQNLSKMIGGWARNLARQESAAN